VNQNQIEQLKKDQKQLRDGAAARRAMAVLLFVSGTDSSLSGYTKDHAKRLKGQYLKYGIDAFRDKRTNQRDHVLTKAEREMVIQTLQIKQPREVIPACAIEHWTTGLLGLYILEQFGKRCKSKTSERLLFREAKLTWHCPGRVYEKADPAARAAWIEATTPVLKKLWEQEDTMILCEDEMVLTSATTIQKV
jgi:transposase